jgi:cytochrome c biogenesis protein
MSESKKPATPAGALWKQLTSIKLTVVVLLTIAAAAVIGTLIPQNKPPIYYQNYFGERLYSVLSRLDLLDMYHSLWFQALLLLLAVNILACSLDRIKVVLKIVFTKTPSFSPHAFSKSSAAEPVTVDAPVDTLLPAYRDLIKRQFSITAEQAEGNEFFLFAETGRFSRLGVYIVHLSVLILLAGALIGSLFGFEGYISLPEGETTDHVFLTDSDKPYDLGFSVRCDHFSVSFHDNGMPREYRSSLSILEGDKVVMQKDILVNKPLQFRNVRIFQASYGTATAKNIDLTFTSRKTGMQYQKIVDMGQTVTLPEDLGEFTANRLLHEYLFQGRHNIGETLIGTLKKGDHLEMVALPLKFQGFDKMRQGDVFITVNGLDRIYYTGLQMRDDPGVPLVYTGFLMIIAGIYITFFLSHRRYCVRLTGSGDQTTVTVYCKANKNQPAARDKARVLINKLTRSKTSPDTV